MVTNFCANTRPFVKLWQNQFLTDFYRISPPDGKENKIYLKLATFCIFFIYVRRVVKIIIKIVISDFEQWRHLSVAVPVIWCFKKQLFLRITLGFFILCINIIKSSQKKIQVIWRSFDPPTRGSFFTKEIDEKYKENP